MNLFNIFYAITHFINVFILYKSAYLFIGKDLVKNRTIEKCSYFLFYIISIIFYFLVDNFLLFILLNIISFYFIFFNYKTSKRYRILLITYVCVIFIITELTSSLLFIPIEEFYKGEGKSIFSIVLQAIFYGIIYFILRRFRNIKIKFEISKVYWLIMFIVPLATLITLYVYLEIEKYTGRNLGIIIFILSIFIINVTMIYFYNIIVRGIEDKIEKEFLQNKEKIYEEQLAIIIQYMDGINEIKHDLKNHLIFIEDLIRNDKKEETLVYLNNKFDILYGNENEIKTNNMPIDSILNFKLKYANKNKIKIKSDIKVPKELNIPAYDIITILGNIIDNAIEATEKLNEDERFINIIIKYDKGRLFIKIENSFNGQLKYEKGELVSTKKDKKFSGIGIKNINNCLKKYNGEIKLETTDNIFSFKLILFL